MKNVLCFGIILALAACASGEKTPLSGDNRDSSAEPMSALDLLGGGKSADAPLAEELDEYPLGTPENPVRADMPAGQREYLSRLICSGRAAPEFSRIGSYGAGPYGSIIDAFAVSCPDGFEKTIYMDMYHPNVRETRAVEGFTIRSAKGVL